MADKHSRSILLYVLLQTLSWTHAMKTSSEVVVEGDGVEIECTTNSSFGVDWKFRNATKEYGLYNEGVVPDAFKMEYSVTNVNYSSYRIFYLSIARVQMLNVGTYICLHGENQQILTSVDLAILTIPVCEPDANSTETVIRYVCNFAFIGNTSSRSEWIGDFCTNSTPTGCNYANEEKIICEFPINRNNRTSLLFAANAMSHGIDVCEIGCKNVDETTTDLSMSRNISVFLQCRVNRNLTTTRATTSAMTVKFRESSFIGNEFYLYGSIAVSTVGVILTIIIIAIFRNTDACSRRNISRNKNNIQQNLCVGPGQQLDDNPTYYELEPSIYAEIPSEPTENTIADNRFEHGSGSNGLYPTNHSHHSVPASHNATGPQTNLDNHPTLLRKDTYDDTAVISSEYADPHDRVVSLPYAKVYEVNANTSRKSPRNIV